MCIIYIYIYTHIHTHTYVHIQNDEVAMRRGGLQAAARAPAEGAPRPLAGGHRGPDDDDYYHH